MMISCVFWLIFGLFLYKGYIKQNYKKERVIKKKRRHLRDAIIEFILMVISAIFAIVFIGHYEVFMNFFFIIVNIGLFASVNMYIASVRYLNYLEDNQDDIII